MKGYRICDYTETEIIEYIMCKEDIVYFTKNYVEDIDDATAEALIAMCGDGEVILNYNENLIEAQLLYIIHFMIFSFDKYIVIYCDTPFLREQVIFNLRYWYERLPYFLQAGIVKYNNNIICMENRCMILFPKNNAHMIPFGIDLMFVINEHNFSHTMKDVLIRALYPTTLCRNNSRIMLYNTFRQPTSFINPIILT
jgi:hypothetical protein